jgi:hypothetical protein
MPGILSTQATKELNVLYMRKLPYSTPNKQAAYLSTECFQHYRSQCAQCARSRFDHQLLK